MAAVMGSWTAGVLFGWFALVYVVFVASGGLPSELKPGRRQPARVLADRLGFFILIFIAPAIILVFACGQRPATLMLSMGSPRSWLPVTALLAVLAAALGFFSEKSSVDLQIYPQYLPARWTAASIVCEAGSWALYLLAYEFALRGYLLAALLPSGAPAAVAATTAIYSIAHTPKSGKEAAGSLFFGVVLSALTLHWHTLVPAFIIHLALALGNDVGALHAASRVSRSSKHAGRR